jgi:hypothetical protein
MREVGADPDDCVSSTAGVTGSAALTLASQQKQDWGGPREPNRCLASCGMSCTSSTGMTGVGDDTAV